MKNLKVFNVSDMKAITMPSQCHIHLILKIDITRVHLNKTLRPFSGLQKARFLEVLISFTHAQSGSSYETSALDTKPHECPPFLANSHNRSCGLVRGPHV